MPQYLRQKINLAALNEKNNERSRPMKQIVLPVFSALIALSVVAVLATKGQAGGGTGAAQGIVVVD